MVEIANKRCFFYNFSAKYRLLSLGVKEEMPDTMVTMVEMSDTMVTMAEMPDTMVTARPRRKVGIQSAGVPSITGLLTLT